jgi:hypothetical protein
VNACFVLKHFPRLFLAFSPCLSLLMAQSPMLLILLLLIATALTAKCPITLVLPSSDSVFVVGEEKRSIPFTFCVDNFIQQHVGNRVKFAYSVDLILLSESWTGGKVSFRRDFDFDIQRHASGSGFQNLILRKQFVLPDDAVVPDGVYSFRLSADNTQFMESERFKILNGTFYFIYFIFSFQGISSFSITF